MSLEKVDPTHNPYEDLFQKFATPPEVERFLQINEQPSIPLERVSNVLAYLTHASDKLPDAPEERKVLLENADVVMKLREKLALLSHMTGFLNPVELCTIDNPDAVKKAFIQNYKKRWPLSVTAEEVIRGEEDVTVAVENPIFSYDAVLARVDDTLKERQVTLEEIEAFLKETKKLIFALDAGDSQLMRLVRVALHGKINDDIGVLLLVRGLKEKNSWMIGQSLKHIYGSVSDEMLNLAQSVQELNNKNIKISVEPTERTEKELTDVLKEDGATADDLEECVHYLLEGYYAYYEKKTGQPLPAQYRYTIVRSELTSIAFDVRDKATGGPTILIPAKPRKWREILGLGVHEIEHHLRQSLNGAVLFGLGGGGLRINSESLYEGLAMTAEKDIYQELLGEIQKPPKPEYTIAAHMASRGQSLYEVFHDNVQKRLQKVKPGGKTELHYNNAWTDAYRTFRGHITTDAVSESEGFAMAKDSGYLWGYMMLRQMEKYGKRNYIESAITHMRSLPMLGHMQMSEKDLPFPNLQLTYRFWDEVLKPRLLERNARVENAASDIRAEMHEKGVL